jgi:hypothetical protein
VNFWTAEPDINIVRGGSRESFKVFFFFLTQLFLSFFLWIFWISLLELELQTKREERTKKWGKILCLTTSHSLDFIFLCFAQILRRFLCFCYDENSKKFASICKTTKLRSSIDGGEETCYKKCERNGHKILYTNLWIVWNWEEREREREDIE